MLQLKQRQTTPPGGWKYQQPDGPMIAAGDFGLLVLAVLKYRAEHGLACSDIAAEVEDEICRRTGAKCAPPRPLQEGAQRQIGVADVWRFLQTMGFWLKSDDLVSQEEAERRAEICAGCRFQAEPVGCWGCSGLFAILFKIIGDRKTRMDAILKSCGVCGCESKVDVFAPLEVLLKFTGNLEFPNETGQTKDGEPVPCWKRTIPLAPESQ